MVNLSVTVLCLLIGVFLLDTCMPYTANIDCLSDWHGIDYVGTVSKTKTGKQCQRWDSQTPHSHNYNYNSIFKDATVSQAANYCRHPYNWKEGAQMASTFNKYTGRPWCHTTDSGTTWEECAVPACECLENKVGRYYDGTKSATKSGKQCNKWVDAAHHNYRDPWVFGGISKLEDAVNYCRNPKNGHLLSGPSHSSPWCYIPGGKWKWEACTIPLCECATSKCQNGAKCVDTVKGYSCTCETGYTGVYCQTSINDCPNPDPCKHGSTCVDGINKYSCTKCKSLWFGKHCDSWPSTIGWGGFAG